MKSKALPILSLAILAWVIFTLLLVPQAVIFAAIAAFLTMLLALHTLLKPRKAAALWVSSAEAEHENALDRFSFLFYVLGLLAWAILAAFFLAHGGGIKESAVLLTVSGTSYQEIIRKARDLLDSQECMRRAAKRGIDPYNSAAVAADCYRKSFAFRRSRAKGG